jgi:hypothetical protein
LVIELLNVLHVPCAQMNSVEAGALDMAPWTLVGLAGVVEMKRHVLMDPRSPP